MVQMNDVKMVYGNTEAAALNGISFTINEGEFVFLVGPSGSGKTTIIKLITGELSPTSGQITVNGFDMQGIKRRKLPKLRRTLGVIFQDFRLIDKMTVYENVAFAMRVVGASNKEIRRRVPQVLELVGLADREKRFPAELSGGEQQRVAIARALITKPKLVFADEPTGNLDSVSSAEVLGFLKRSVNELGQTIVMVTHDAVAASYADRAIVFADGQIVADEANPTAETMNELLMAERERATRTAVTSTRADTLARLAGVKDVPNLPITDAPLPPAGRTGTMRHARAAAQHAR